MAVLELLGFVRVSAAKDQFKNIVRKSRNDNLNEVDDGVLEGKTYQGNEAIKAGLVDGVKTAADLMLQRREEKCPLTFAFTYALAFNTIALASFLGWIGFH